jgi:hypothetical protein
MQTFHLALGACKAAFIQKPFQDLKEHKNILFSKMQLLQFARQCPHCRMLL